MKGPNTEFSVTTNGKLRSIAFRGRAFYATRVTAMRHLPLYKATNETMWIRATAATIPTWMLWKFSLHRSAASA
jgi:hypothetical protein